MPLKKRQANIIAIVAMPTGSAHLLERCVVSRPPPIADKVISRIGHSVPMADYAKQISIEASILTRTINILREYKM